MIQSIASLLSIIGAILNAYGVGKNHYTTMLYGQETWILSNALWIISSDTIPQLLTFITFFIAAIYGTILMKKRGITC